MNKIIERLPDFVDAEPRIVEFETLDELLAIDWVAKWKKIVEPACQYCKDDTYLMVSTKTWWWVVGSIKDIEALDLPTWKSVQL